MFLNRDKGSEYEKLAKRHLQQQGLELIAENYYCRYGEIDLIMSDAGVICFIEVKFREGNGFGGAAYSIPASKIRKISKTALHFISREPRLQQSAYRFDALLISNHQGQTQFKWLKNGFEAVGDNYC